MKSIFIISSGSYSDYQVHMVAETREEAERIVEKIQTGNHDEYEIEERPFVTADDVAVRVKYIVSGDVYDDGTTSSEPLFETAHCKWVLASEGFRTKAEPVTRAEFNPAPRYQFEPGGERRRFGRIWVSGYDREAVLKAASDKLGQARVEVIDAAEAREAAYDQLGLTVVKLAERMREQRGQA